jgi:hypothetical protein
MTLDLHIEALVRRVVDQELRARGVGPATYSSTSLPPDLRSKDRFHRIAPKVPGAFKSGRVWHVDADAWRVYRSGAAATPADEVDAVVARMLRAS